MGLRVLTQEVHAELTGFPLLVSAFADCGCGEHEACDRCGKNEIVFDIDTRDDGAVGSRLVIRGNPDQLRDAFREALVLIGE